MHWEGDVQKTDAEGAEDGKALLQRYLEAPDKVDGQCPQSKLDDEAGDFDSNPSMILENVRSKGSEYGRRRM